MKGTVLPSPGGDWLLLRRDGVLQLDVRITLKTHDDHLIYMSYRGMRHGPAWVIEQLNKGEKVDPSQYYFRSTPSFETASDKYRFLNRIVCVATGRREPTGQVYEVFQHSLGGDLRQHRQDVFAELRGILAHREMADFLHDLHLDAGNLAGRAQRVLGGAGEVVFAGQQVERADPGVDRLHLSRRSPSTR